MIPVISIIIMLLTATIIIIRMFLIMILRTTCMSCLRTRWRERSRGTVEKAPSNLYLLLLHPRHLPLPSLRKVSAATKDSRATSKESFHSSGHDGEVVVRDDGEVVVRDDGEVVVRDDGEVVVRCGGFYILFYYNIYFFNFYYFIFCYCCIIIYLFITFTFIIFVSLCNCCLPLLKLLIKLLISLHSSPLFQTF